MFLCKYGHAESFWRDKIQQLLPYQKVGVADTIHCPFTVTCTSLSIISENKSIFHYPILDNVPSAGFVQEPCFVFVVFL